MPSRSLTTFATLTASILLAGLLAGCSTGPAASGPTSGEDHVVITRPGDYSADANATNADLPHLHDYWGGLDRIVVMDGWPTEPGPGLGGGQQVPIYNYRPASGHVVPQGAAFVEVTMTWTPAADDFYVDPQLWVKTAAENEPVKVGPIESGQKVAFATNNDRNDLPHQLLSAWVFQFRLSQREDLSMLRFKANVTIHVEAVRGLPIPFYPGHPDRWNNATEVLLVDVTRQLSYLQDPGDAGCDGFACPQVEVPQNGTIVPPDASVVEAILTVELGSPQTVGFSYHGAEGRTFTRLEPTSTNGNERTYVIQVGPYGDGPYAKQSQWEFAPFIDGPAPDTFIMESFHLKVVAKKHLGG